ncbi:MAG: methyltransferase, partial [Muribaculaceae bacterium]|nr:methyltransferase [Muribaculaceae bacterium]
LWDGKVADGDARDAQTRGILDFNDMVAQDERVEKVILPLRDGLTLIYKKP